MEGRFVRHRQILSTRPERRRASAERPGVPKPDARGHDVRSVKPGARWKAHECYHDPGEDVWRPRPGRGRVGRDERGPDMVATPGRDDFAEMLKRYDRAMNRLVNGDPGPSRRCVPAVTRRASRTPGVVSDAVEPKSMHAGIGSPRESSRARARSSGKTTLSDPRGPFACR